MGYTHYWYRSKTLSPGKFALAVADCEKVCNGLEIPLGDCFGEGAPKFSPRSISFNGRAIDSEGDGSYEPFRIDQVFADEHRATNAHGQLFAFTKTNFRPYDLCVQACLIVFDFHFSEDLVVSSDGDDKAWNEARSACQHFLGYGPHFKLEGDS